MTVSYLTRPGKPRLAYVHTEGAGPQVVFMGGYRSDMTGTKATYLEEQAKVRGQGFLRFDYSGHGASEGAFRDGTIGAWKQDALDMLDRFAQGPVVIVGSSMGGWMALLCALARPKIIKGLIGIAAAPDFTEEIYGHLSAAQKKNLAEKGYADVPTDYSADPYHFTAAFYGEAKNHLLLGEIHRIVFPMRLIQGKRDTDVPWKTALEIEGKFKGPDVKAVFIEDGDHRLSRPQDLAIIDREIKSISACI